MEQPSKPAAEERHDARRHISPQLDQAVRRGAGRTTSPNTTAPMSPIHYTSTRCSCLWTGPNPLWTPASRWRFTSTQAKLQKPCWTPRQHDTKPQTSQKKTQHRSGPDKHRSCSSQWSNCPDCSSGPTRVIKGSSSTVSSTKPQVTRAVHNHKASDRSSPPSSKTSVFTAPTCTQCEYANVQQTGRNHMLVKVKKESNSNRAADSKCTAECDVYLCETWTFRLMIDYLCRALIFNWDRLMSTWCCVVSSSDLFLCHLNM